MALTWLSLILVVTLAVACRAACPSSCYCHEEGEYVSCVGDGIWQLLPDISTTTIRLELRNYFISSLSAQYLQDLVQLHELKLQQTRIETIENATFISLQKLQRLDLSQNNLSAVTSAAFKGLGKLRFLDLSSNNIQVIDEAFVELSNLEQLNLRDNRIPQLTTHTFTGLQKVQYLNLDANSISSVEVGTFQYLTNLAHLIISNNPLTTLSRLDFFGSRLQFIDISHVGLERVPQSLTKFVRDLRLAKNNLTWISAGDFDSYPYLGLLVLDDNCVNEIENDALGRQEYLIRLWLNGNCLTKVPPNLPPSLMALYMEENRLTELPSYSFRGLIRLEQLFLQRNDIQTLATCAFCDLVNLKSLDLQANRIENLTDGVFASLTQLETLDLSQNILKFIDSRCFEGLSCLKTLQMSRVSTAVQVDEALFDPLHTLQILEVYDSAPLVHKIINSTRMLHGLRKVQELNIMHNKIVRLRSDFPSFLPNLKVIKMSDNLWRCDRDVIWLSTWIRQSNVQFYSSYSIRCATPLTLQFKPLMMLTESDIIGSSTTLSLPTTLPITDSILITTWPTTQARELPSWAHSTSSTFSYSLSSSSNTVADENDTDTGIGRTAASATMASQRSTDKSVATENSSSEPKLMSAFPFRYHVIRDSLKPTSEVSTTQRTWSFTRGASATSSERISNESAQSSDHSEYRTPETTLTSTNATTDMLSLVAELTTTKSMDDKGENSSVAHEEATEEKHDVLGKVKTSLQTVASQRRVVSSRLRGHEDPTSRPSHWDQTTTIVVSATLAGGCLLVVVGILTLFTLFRCRHRYQPVKHRQMRRSSSISYYPQKDEVSIVTLTEGTVGLRTNSHHGLGNKLYYIMESGGCSGDPTKDALPDPQLQELLPHSASESGTLY